LFLSNEFYAVAEPIIYRNRKTHFVSPGQPHPKAAVKTVANLDEKQPIFCRVGECRYWHTDLKRIKQHRDSHLWNLGYLCPNQKDNCPHSETIFTRRDAVISHCKQFPVCGKFLEANGGIIPRPEEGLRPYDPNFHKPRETTGGWTGRGDVEHWQQFLLVTGIDAEGTP